MTVTIKKASGDEIRVCCFECGEEDFKLYYNKRKKVGKCFKCEYVFKGSMLELLDKIDAGFSDIQDLGSDIAVAHKPDPIFLPTGVEPLENCITGQEYFIERSLNAAEIAQEFYVWYAPTGYYTNRLIFPVFNRKEDMVGFVARSVHKENTLTMLGEPKYLYPKGFKTHRNLYGIERLVHPHAVLVEGVMDVLAHPHDSCVAVFGKVLHEEQLRALQSIGVDTIYICFDADATEAAEAAAVKAHKYGMTYVGIVKMPDGYDPADLSKDVFSHLLYETQPIDQLTYRLKGGWSK